MNILIDTVRAAIASEVAYYKMLERTSGVQPTVAYAQACAAYMDAFTDIGDGNAVGVARLLLEWSVEANKVEKHSTTLPPHAPWLPILARRLELVEKDDMPHLTTELERLMEQRAAKKALKRGVTEEKEEEKEAEEAGAAM